jgi:hypothetical protein
VLSAAREASLAPWVGLTVAALGLSGCAAVQARPAWTEDATLTPSWSRLGGAALHAVLHPATWLPAVGAGVFQIDHFDAKVSRWASTRDVMFGSIHEAEVASNVLDAVQAGAALGSGLAIPGPDDCGEWFRDKAYGLGLEGLAVGAGEGLVAGLKSVTSRRRPNGEGYASFPSGHTALAFTLAAQTTRNLDRVEMPAPLRLGLDASAYTLAMTVGWARVEAEQHFPSDVLAGAAIGNFFGVFFHDAFLGTEDARIIRIQPTSGGVDIGVAWAF